MASAVGLYCEIGPVDSHLCGERECAETATCGRYCNGPRYPRVIMTLISKSLTIRLSHVQISASDVEMSRNGDVVKLRLLVNRAAAAAAAAAAAVCVAMCVEGRLRACSVGARSRYVRWCECRASGLSERCSNTAKLDLGLMPTHLLRR